MHDLSHIERVNQTALALAEEIKEDFDVNIITFATYLHGFIYKHEKEIRDFLAEKQIDNQLADKIILVAWESQKSSNAVTHEGKLLHDAHMIEGGKTFLVTKSLVTGSVRGQSLIETLKYMKANVLDKGQCYFEITRNRYLEAQQYLKDYLDDIYVNFLEHENNRPDNFQNDIDVV